MSDNTTEAGRSFRRTVQKHTGIMPKDQNEEVLKILVDLKATYDTVLEHLGCDKAKATPTQTAWQQPVGPIKEILPPDFQTNHNIKIDMKNINALHGEYKTNLISYIFYKTMSDESVRERQSDRMRFGPDHETNEKLIDQFNKTMTTPCTTPDQLARVMRAMLAEFDKTVKDPDYVPPVQVEFVEHLEPTAADSSSGNTNNSDDLFKWD